MSHSQFRRIRCLYLDMHGLIFKTSIWLLAGSTRLLLRHCSQTCICIHIHTAAQQPNCSFVRFSPKRKCLLTCVINLASLTSFGRLNQNPSARAHFLYYPPPTSSSYLKCLPEILYNGVKLRSALDIRNFVACWNQTGFNNLTDSVQANQLSFRHYPKLILVQ